MIEGVRFNLNFMFDFKSAQFALKSIKFGLKALLIDDKVVFGSLLEAVCGSDLCSFACRVPQFEIA